MAGGMTEEEELEYLRLKKRKAAAAQPVGGGFAQIGNTAQSLLPAAREREASLEASRAAMTPAQRTQADATSQTYANLYGPKKGSVAEGAMNNFGAFSNQTLNSATLGNADNINAAATKYLKLGPGSPQGNSFSDFKDTERQNRQALREAAPEAAMAGDVAGYLIPGTAAYKAAGTGLRMGANVLINPTLRAATAARWARLPGVVQYAGRLGVVGGIGAADYGLYRSTVDATNLEAQDRRDVGLRERGKMFAEGATDPLAWIGGAGLSVAYRTGRGVAAAVKNAKNTGSIRPPPVAGQVGKAPLSNLVTPSWVQAEVRAAKAPPLTDRQKALRNVLNRMKEQGMTVADAYKKLNQLAFEGKTTVDEMAFELLGASNDQLAVALGSVAGDAQATARTRLQGRSSEAPRRLQKELRAALGLKGSDFYSLQDELYKRRINEPDYSGPYAKTISQPTWTKRILPKFRDKNGSARSALNDAIRYASDLNELGVARELDELRIALDGGMADPPVLSTQALDYVDRMLGDMASGVSASTGRTEVASGIRSAQGRIRGGNGTGLDPETGLNVPRQVSAELRAAGGLSAQEVEAGKQGALQFGRQAAGKGFDLEQLEREWAFEAQKYGINGQPSELINGSLLMGWLRGIEDKVSTSQTPGEVVRFLIGSDRQREKLMAMLPKVTANMTKAEKAEVTKRVQMLLGRPKKGKQVAVPGRIERERVMFENQNRIIGNSQTAARNEAIQAQGGLQRAVMAVADAVFDPNQAAKKVARYMIQRGTMPDIFKPGINREMGDILFTNGRERLKKVFDELRALEQAGGRPPPTGGGAGGRRPRGGGTGGLVATGTPSGGRRGTPAGPIRAAGFGSNQSGSIRTDVATTLAGGAAGYQAGKDLDLNGDGKVNWEDRAAGVMYGVGAKYAVKPVLKRVFDKIGSPPTGAGGRRRLGISKGGVLPEGPAYERVPTMEESFDNRFAMAKMTVEQQARKAGETLTPEQLQQRAVQEYRDLYKKDPPGVKSDGTMEAQGWQRALNDAYEALKKDQGEGNFTAYDVERAAIDDFVSYYGASRLPKDTLEQADKLVPGTVDPSDLTPPPIRAAGFGFGGGKKPPPVPGAPMRKAVLEPPETMEEVSDFIIMLRDNPPPSQVAEILQIPIGAGSANKRGAKEIIERERVQALEILYKRYHELKRSARKAAEPPPPEPPSADVLPFQPRDTKPQGPGALRGDLGNALAGAGLGASKPEDTTEERLRNIGIGAGIGFGARRLGKAMGSVEDGARRTVGSPRVASAGVGGGRKPPWREPPNSDARARADAEVKSWDQGGSGNYGQKTAVERARGMPNEVKLLEIRKRQIQYDNGLNRKVIPGWKVPAQSRMEIADINARLKELRSQQPDDLPPIIGNGFGAGGGRAGRSAPTGTPQSNRTNATLATRSRGLQTVVDDIGPAVIPPGYGRPIKPPVTIKSPGQVIAKGLRGIDRGLRDPKSDRVLAPVLAAGKMRKPKRGEAAIEAMRSPREVAQAVSEAIRRGNTAAKTDLARPSLAKAGQKNAQIVQQFRNRLQSEADGRLSIEATRTQMARATKAAKAELIDMHGEVARSVSRNDEAGAVAAAKRIEQLRQDIADIKRATPAKERASIDATLALIDTAMLQAEQTMSAAGYMFRTALEPSRRNLARDGELLDLLTNPNRAKDAYRISQAKPLGSFEKTGQALAMAGVAGAGALTYKGVQDKKRRDEEDYYAKRDAWDHNSKHVSGYSGERLQEAQEFMNAVVLEEGEKGPKPDGKYGPKTAGIIRRYQEMRGLTVNGRMTRETINDLESQMNGSRPRKA